MTGSDVASRLTDAVASLLSRRGYDYPPSGDSNSLLWCLGGPSLYRNEEDRESASADDCLDLNLVVCDAHRAISLELYPYDLVPERGGSGPDDPLRSEPIKLDGEQDIVEQVMVRVEPWLDSIVKLPDRR